MHTTFPYKYFSSLFRKQLKNRNALQNRSLPSAALKNPIPESDRTLSDGKITLPGPPDGAIAPPLSAHSENPA